MNTLRPALESCHPRRLIAKGLHFFVYAALAFVCIFFSFAIGQSAAHAAPDVIDLTIKTIATNETVSLPIGVAASNPAYTNVVVHWGDGAITTITSNTDSADMTHTYATASTWTLTVGAPATG